MNNEFVLKLNNEASDEVKEIYNWYKMQLAGSGNRFITQLDEGFTKIKSNTEA